MVDWGVYVCICGCVRWAMKWSVFGFMIWVVYVHVCTRRRRGGFMMMDDVEGRGGLY